MKSTRRFVRSPNNVIGGDVFTILRLHGIGGGASASYSVSAATPTSQSFDNQVGSTVWYDRNDHSKPFPWYWTNTAPKPGFLGIRSFVFSDECWGNSGNLVELQLWGVTAAGVKDRQLANHNFEAATASPTSNMGGPSYGSIGGLPANYQCYGLMVRLAGFFASSFGYGSASASVVFDDPLRVILKLPGTADRFLHPQATREIVARQIISTPDGFGGYNLDYRITLATPHGFVGSKVVTVAGVDVPAFNGNHSATVVSPTILKWIGFSPTDAPSPLTACTGTVQWDFL